MSVNPLFDQFNRAVVSPLARRDLEGGGCTKKSLWQRVYQAGAAVFSVAGNIGFYAVAKSFGDRYSPYLGIGLGASEFTSYVTFRLQNFDGIWKEFEETARKAELNVPLSPKETPVFSVISAEEAETPLLDTSAARSRSGRCKEISMKVGMISLGIIAQFPLMYLVYVSNKDNYIYPVLAGACEASFTILSLLTTLKSTQRSSPQADSLIENQRDQFTKKIDLFLEELPEKYKDPEFVEQIETIVSDDSKTQEEMGKELLGLIVQAQGLPEQQKGEWDPFLTKVAKGIGLLLAGYITTVNAFVSYEGVKAWREDQEALAIATTIFVSLANLQLLNECCMGSAASYYEGIRDIAKKQYRPPLAYSIAPISWTVGRVFSNALSWLSCGTNAISARDYIPKVGEELIAPAPFSSAVLLNDSLAKATDDVIMEVSSRLDQKARRFSHLHQSLATFKKDLQNASFEVSRRFLEISGSSE